MPSLNEAWDAFHRYPTEKTGLTVSDFFAGAGGNTTGAEAAGARSIFALNHWQTAIESHAANHPHVDHAVEDIRERDAKYVPATDIMIASPECTFHSRASGRKRLNRNQMSLWDEYEADLDDSEGERSRLLMQQVIKFTEYHRYPIVIVENVVDVMYWHNYNAWWKAMCGLGYSGKALFLNAQFFNVPQSRDRFYAVFWRNDLPAPDLEFCPPAWSEAAESWVNAYQSWKRLDRQWGTYGRNGQYVYRCPITHEEVLPLFVPSGTIIDWSTQADKIGERTRPLSENTMNRIRAGLRKYMGNSHIIDTSYAHANHNGKVRGLAEPDMTQTTRQSKGIVISYYTRDSAHESTDNPLPTIPTENKHALVVPESFLTTYNNNAVYAGPGEPMPTVTTVDRLSLVVSQYNNAGYRTLDEPMPAQTTINKNTLVDGKLSDDSIEHILNDCTFRMLQPQELKLGMSFPDEYIIKGTKRDQVRQIGGAVAPNVMQAIIGRCTEALA